jgi:beta-1,4-mannosyl-glycoprotein beta-1,4-N-acetylglucosaminyltransferase
VIINAVVFDGNTELLTLRLNELDDVVDKFYIIESELTLSGHITKLVYPDFISLWSRWKDKIAYVRVPAFVISTQNKTLCNLVEDRYAYICNYLKRIIPEIDDDAVFVITNNDEIPSSAALSSYHPQQGAVCCMTNFCHFYFNYSSVNKRWHMPRLLPGHVYNRLYVQELRDYPELCKIDNAGWRFAYLMGEQGLQAIRAKLWSEQSLRYRHTLPVLKAIQNKVPVDMKKLNSQYDSNSGYLFRKVGIDSSYPKYVLDNLNQYKKRGYIL